MAQPFRTPVLDSVPRVADEVAVGEDLNFQRKWWTFERIIWSFFVLILICDLLGVFGRGWLAKGKLSTPDHALTLDYERVERSATASKNFPAILPPESAAQYRAGVARREASSLIQRSAAAAANSPASAKESSSKLGIHHSGR